MADVAGVKYESLPFPFTHTLARSLARSFTYLLTHPPLSITNSPFPPMTFPPPHPFFRLVHHPHIVRLEDVYEGAGEDGNMYIVTELLEGGELFTALVGRAR